MHTKRIVPAIAAMAAALTVTSMMEPQMKRIVIAAVITVAAFSASACGSSGSPQPSHADRLACRTVYRLQQLYDASGGLPVFAAGSQAAQALAASAVGASQPLGQDLTAASHRLLLVNTPTTADLAPLERDCGKLGITAKNAENVS